MNWPNVHHRTSTAWNIVTTIFLQFVTWSGVIKKLNKINATYMTCCAERPLAIQLAVLCIESVQFRLNWNSDGGEGRWFSPKINLENSLPDTNQIRKLKWMKYRQMNARTQIDRNWSVMTVGAHEYAVGNATTCRWQHGLMTNGHDSCISSIGPLLIHTYDNYGEAPIPATPNQRLNQNKWI